MTLLWFNLLLVFIFALFSRYFSMPSVISDNITVPIRPNKLLLLATLVSLVLISGLRNGIGDTYFYKHAFSVNNFGWEDASEQKNIGFWLFQKVIKEFSDNPQALIFTASLITNLLIIIVFFKYSRMIELSLYVYITGGLFLVSMNGLRQVMTASIIFCATKYIINGNWLKYSLVVLLASTIHQSALVLLPIYFLVRYKAWSKATIILLVFSVIIVIGFDLFSSLLFSAIEDTQYGHYSEFKEGGANAVRVAVDAVPLIIAFLGREKLREIFPSSDYFVNMALVGFVFMIVSTQNWIFARFSIYFTLYQLILVSWIVKLFREREQRFVYISILICYLIYYYYECVVSLNLIYKNDFLDSFF